MRESLSYTKKKGIEWGQFSSPNLNLEKRRKYSNESYISCGSASLSLVTGMSPIQIEKHCPNPKVGWYTTRVIKFLRDHGYTVIELSKRDVLKTHWFNLPIGTDHCLMMSVRVDEEENSMYVMHKGKLYHHFDKEDDFNSLFFINKPTQDVLLIYHKKWARKKNQINPYYYLAHNVYA